MPCTKRRGQGGVAVIYKEELQETVTVCKVDAHKRYIWVKIHAQGGDVYIAGCYIPHRESPFYTASGIDKNDPFGDLYADIEAYMQKGEIMIVGDMNARTGNMQMQKVDLMENVVTHEDYDTLEPEWKRCSEDKGINPQGLAFISMLTTWQLIALNGTGKYANSGTYTCYTSNKGMSVIDYVIVSHAAAHLICKYMVGEISPNSDHTPLHIWLRVPNHVKRSEIKAETWSYKMQWPRKKDYATLLDQTLAMNPIPSDITQTWDIFKHAMYETLEATMGKTYTKGKKVKGLPRNSWFDIECKEAKRALRLARKNMEDWSETAKAYNTLKRQKRGKFELRREQEALALFKRDSKGEWRKIKGRRHEIYGDISPESMYAYVEKLYVHGEIKEMPKPTKDKCIRNHLDADAVNKSIKKLKNGKAPDTSHICSEMLKWSGTIAREWIHVLLNQAIAQGLPNDWQQNWITALFKSGDKNQPANYRTIMVSSCMSKLLGSTLEQAISSWAEVNNKRAKTQAGFRPKHSTIDHLVSIRVLMEESRLKGKPLFCCFVDFKKAFDTVPRDGLWQRMQKIGVPTHLRNAVASLYAQVRCQLKTSNTLSQEFSSNMGVKQGCPLSPTLFGLYIDRLEEFLLEFGKENDEYPTLGHMVLTLLIYADDVVLFAHAISSLQKSLDAIHAFCMETGLSVNVGKTKIMQIGAAKTENQQMLMYDGQEIEVVESFKYLGVSIPSNHNWGKCVHNRINAGNAKYYQFENMCKQNTIHRWEIKAMVFETCVVQTLLYGVEVWGASISAHTWNETEKIQKKFLCRHLGVKKTTPYSVLLLETGRMPIEMKALRQVYTYIMKIKLMPPTRLPHIAWNVGGKPQKTKKSKFLVSSLIQDIKKWFGRWNVQEYVDMQIEQGKTHEYMLKFDIALLQSLHEKWQNTMHRSKWEYYCKYINPKYWDNYKAPKPEAQPHISTPMPYKARHAITMMRMRSHMLKIETGSWLKMDRNQRKCNTCSMQAIEDEAHVTLECPAYAHIRVDFQQVLQSCHTFEDLLAKATSTPTAIGFFFHRILEHHTLLREKAKKDTKQLQHTSSI